LKDVEIHGDCCPSHELIINNDSDSTLFYLDPPYLHETRTAKKAYEFEMTRNDHEGLLGLIRTLEGKVFISGYRSTLYDDALDGWTRHEFDMPNHSGQGVTKQRRVECLWESP
jgi:DNA adenine methylase